MYYAEFEGVNSFLVGMSKLILKNGVKRSTRGLECFEIPNPIMIKLKNPLSRIVTIPQRKWNHLLPFVESLWLASGRNDMQLVGHYLKKLFDYSDDKQFMRGGYGPRFRFFNGISEDYKAGYLDVNNDLADKKTTVIDQFDFIAKTFSKDPFTRQAIISIGDPAEDCFSFDHSLKQTKDFPCTRSLHFQRVGNALDLIVHMRSNDFMWGASGVNIFNFTFIQEYFSQILKLEIGAYYHLVDNFHYYVHSKEMIQELADIDVESVEDIGYQYKKTFQNLDDFDERVRALGNYEKEVREKNISTVIDFGDDFFNDWAKVFLIHNTKTRKSITFSNPILNQIAKQKLTKEKIQEQKKQFTNTFPNDENNLSLSFWREYI